MTRLQSIILSRYGIEIRIKNKSILWDTSLLSLAQNKSLGVLIEQYRK